MQIRKTARYGNCASSEGLDYHRTILNHTGETVKICDASGRAHYYDGGWVQHGDTQILAIEEWYRGTDATGMIDVNLEDMPEYKHESGIVITTHITLSALQEVTEGFYLDSLGLVISLRKYVSIAKHPRFITHEEDRQESRSTTGVSIEVHDPRKRIDIQHATMGGQCVPVAPIRIPTPAKECVIIRRWDPSTGGKIATEYELSDLTTGEGKCGIRLYATVTEANADKRNPEKVAYALKEISLANHKAEMAKDIRAAIVVEEKRKYEDKVAAVVKENRRSEEKVWKETKARSKEKTGFWSNALRVTSDVVRTFGSWLVSWF